jgi:hypothetical protein
VLRAPVSNTGAARLVLITMCFQSGSKAGVRKTKGGLASGRDPKHCTSTQRCVWGDCSEVTKAHQGLF